MKHRSAYLGLLAVFLVATGQLAAHHSEAVVYDLSTVMTLKGVVTQVALMNPHGSLILTVKDAAGNSVDRRVELPSATAMAQRGLGRSLKQGDEITIEVWVARSGPGRATSRMIRLPNGKVVSTMTAWHCASAVQEGCFQARGSSPPWAIIDTVPLHLSKH
jgi:Family of unknown function (DUF6152)